MRFSLNESFFSCFSPAPINFSSSLPFSLGEQLNSLLGEKGKKRGKRGEKGKKEKKERKEKKEKKGKKGENGREREISVKKMIRG